MCELPKSRKTICCTIQRSIHALTVSGDSQQISMPTSSSTIERTDVCMMGPPTGPMYPVWETKEAKPLEAGVYFIAHNRFGYLPHLNTLDLQVTRVGLPKLTAQIFSEPVALLTT